MKNWNTGFNFSIKFLKLSPNCCKIGFIFSIVSETLFLISAKALSTISRNQSHFLYINTKPATSATTAATTAPIGFADKIAHKPFPAVPAALNTPDILENAPIAFDTPEESFPKIIKAGPIAATTAPIFTIVSFCVSFRFLNHCEKAFTFSTTRSRTGATVCIKVFPRSAPATFKLLSATFAWSGGSSVALNVSSTTFP